MAYSHTFVDGGVCHLPVGKAVCVGLNYADHVVEMGSQRTGEPLLFIKPATALRPLSDTMYVPEGRGEVHFEAEMAVLIGKELRRVSEGDVTAGIAGIGLALDLTLRDLQKTLKNAGLPWEKAKGWDGSCPVSAFVRPDNCGDFQNLDLRLWQNGVLRQSGNTGQMLTSVLPLISYISQIFTLMPGDLVLTGTPEGVGPISPGDRLELALGTLLRVCSGEVVSV